MLSLHDAISKIQETRWTFTNNFNVQFLFDGNNKLAKRYGLDGLDINLYVKECKIPQIGTSNLIEKFTLDRPRIAMGAWECTTFDFTFKDFDNLDLYKRFVAYVAGERYTYFDQYKFKIKVLKLGDHYGDEPEKHVLTLDNCYITTVSQITFSNDTEAQVLEFGVQIKSASLESVEGLLSDKQNEAQLRKEIEGTNAKAVKATNAKSAAPPPSQKVSDADLAEMEAMLQEVRQKHTDVKAYVDANPH